MSNSSNYTEDNIKSLDWKEHIRMRPGMYIGKLGNGSSPDDGIYILLKEVLDNSIDEFVMGAGKTIEISINNNGVTVRDYGRGIPLGKVVDVVSKMNTGGKYDTRAFKKSVGLNGVGTKAVNALSINFKVESVRDGKSKYVVFEQGELIDRSKEEKILKPADAEAVEGMGSISKHQNEHLMPTDEGISLYRRKLKKLIKELEEGNKLPQPQQIKGMAVRTYGQDTILKAPQKDNDDRKFIKSMGRHVLQLQFDAEQLELKDRDINIINNLRKLEKELSTKNYYEQFK